MNRNSNYAITILDYALGKVFTYELSDEAVRHNDDYELVEFFGHREEDCHYMVHRLGNMELNMVELPF